jgi:uncharacterized phiE125 gp8 family phage protein
MASQSPGEHMNTATVLKTAPAIEPITAAEVKTQLRLEDTTFDTLVTALIPVARNAVEQYLRRSLITQTWTAYFDSFETCFRLHRGPFRSITSVKYYDDDGVLQTWSSSAYFTDLVSIMARVIHNADYDVIPTVQSGRPNPIQIEYVAGYGDAAANVPAPIRQAIISLTIDMFEHPEQSPEVTMHESMLLQRLLSPYEIIEVQ